MTEYRNYSEEQYDPAFWDEESDQQQPPQEKKTRYLGTQLLLIIQIVLCALVLLMTLGLKLIGGDWYEGFRSWYLTEVNKSIIASDDIAQYQDAWNAIFSPKDRTGETAEQDSSSELGTALQVSYPRATTSERSNKPVLLSVALSAPLKSGALTSEFALRQDPFTKEEKWHHGLDIASPEGSEIGCVLPGQVIEAQESPSYGKYVIVDHGNEIQTLYAHCNELLVKAGDSVSRGTVLAKVGQTGNATGNHLHLELRINGESYDPQPLLGGVYV